MNQNAAQKEYSFEVLKEIPQVASVQPKGRWTSLDMARGLAITLMILSHCVKGLLARSMIPEWGILPIHLLTKFSSSLFILIFGISLSVYFIPHVQKKTWKKKRAWMIKRGIELMIWYKLLTIVQMFQFYPQSMIVDTLLFKRMPDFVEILSFYSIMLLWIPFTLPTWSKLKFIPKLLSIVILFIAGQWLHHNFDFWGYDTIKAILVEKEGYYTFGQLQRGALVFFGLLLGDTYKNLKDYNFDKSLLPKICIALGTLSLGYFSFNNSPHITKSLIKVADNVGKHPFSLDFFTFSLGGALLILGFCLISSVSFKKLMSPISFLGRHSLNAFALHIIIIFYFYRYYFDLHRNVTYIQSLGLTAACIGSIIVILYFWNKLKATVL